MSHPVARDVERAADAIRAANHTSHHGPVDGEGAYAVVGNLVELTGRLPQLLDYLARSLRRADVAAHYDDRGRNPADALDRADDALVEAHRYLGPLHDQLTTAHNQLGHLGRLITED
ncbi:hypothetical protein WCD74_22845 [Actinomycetospora sp. OC33-EN08]|uniref:Uncharacterized protein n=1 Tax=Actinomycetospora aurantiaca TaxID=3129233 RepID=A0ABU8MTH6_9PSEU